MWGFTVFTIWWWGSDKVDNKAKICLVFLTRKGHREVENIPLPVCMHTFL